MSYTVIINNGLTEVCLPGGAVASGGQTVFLTDAQFGMLSPSAVSSLFSSVTPVSSGAAASKWVFDVGVHGAKGDGRVAADAVMGSGSPNLACTTSTPFTAKDVGKLVMVKGAAATGQTTLVTTIKTFTDSGHVVLNASTSNAVSGAIVMWATDDTAAFIDAVNAAVAYALAGPGTATVMIPAPTGSFYGIGGALVTGGSTKGNAQIPIPIIPTTARKVSLVFQGSGNGSALEHWEQLVPQTAGSTLVSFGVFANPTAQVTSINNGGNACVIGGPSQPGGYGVAPGVFSNMLVTFKDFSILTTHSSYGLTYSAADFSGVAEANIFDFAYGTTGTVAGNDYANPSVFGTGVSIGLLMPANGNNDNNAVRNLSCHGGYTYSFFATEHTVIDRICILYCWAALCVVGTYYSSVGSVHGVNVVQASIEQCVNLVYVVGGGSAGVGPFLFGCISTESGSPTFADNNSGTGLAGLLGEIELTGLFTVSGVNTTHPTGLKIRNRQMALPATVQTGNYTVSVIDQVILADATAGNLTITLISSAWTPNKYTVIKTDSSVHTVTVAAAGSERINGAATQVLSAQWGSLTVASARVASTWGWYAASF